MYESRLPIVMPTFVIEKGASIPGRTTLSSGRFSFQRMRNCATDISRVSTTFLPCSTHTRRQCLSMCAMFPRRGMRYSRTACSPFSKRAPALEIAASDRPPTGGAHSTIMSSEIPGAQEFPEGRNEEQGDHQSINPRHIPEGLLREYAGPFFTPVIDRRLEKRDPDVHTRA